MQHPKFVIINHYYNIKLFFGKNGFVQAQNSRYKRLGITHGSQNNITANTMKSTAQLDKKRRSATVGMRVSSQSNTNAPNKIKGRSNMENRTDTRAMRMMPKTNCPIWSKSVGAISGGNWARKGDCPASHTGRKNAIINTTKTIRYVLSSALWSQDRLCVSWKKRNNRFPIRKTIIKTGIAYNTETHKRESKDWNALDTTSRAMRRKGKK